MQVTGIDPSLQDIFNVRDYGAVGNGVHNDTAAILEAAGYLYANGGVLFFPPGTYLFSANITIPQNTVVMGSGTLKAAPIGAWSGSPYYGITNENAEASVITDENLSILGITIDYTDLPAADGTRHCIYLRKVRKVKIAGVTILQGSSSVALLGCDNTEEIGNTYTGFTNCGSDHWDGPSNCRVVGCHIESGDGFAVAQMANWNPDGTLVTDPGQTAADFVFAGNTVVSHETSATPIQIEPLRAGGLVRNVTITGNVFVNTYLAMRGDTSGAVVASNTFSGFAGTSEAITAYTRAGGSPGAFMVSSNVIRDPLTSNANSGVIRVESAEAQIFHNAIIGTGYTAASIYTGSPVVGQIFGNYTQMTPIAARLQTGMILAPDATNYYAWTDASGTFPRMLQQNTDNNWIFQQTDGTGALRAVFSVYARSSTSELIHSIGNLFNSTVRHAPTAGIAAAGVAIGTATVLAANFNEVTTCTAGVDDGVRLSVSVGLSQTVTNSSAATLNVYPQNSGAGQIDGGGIGAPVTVAAGKTKTFLQYSTNNYRTVAEF